MKKNPIKSGLRETMAGKVTFLFLLFLYTGVMLYLFWMECYQVPGFQSDMPDYVNKVERAIIGKCQLKYLIRMISYIPDGLIEDACITKERFAIKFHLIAHY